MNQTATVDESPRRKNVWLYRLPLLALLAVAVSVLAFDYRSRWQQKSALQAVYAMLPQEDTADEIREEAICPDAVHRMLAREPDAVPVDTHKELQEVYRWRGAFYTYSVWVTYRRDFAAQKLRILAEVRGE